MSEFSPLLWRFRFGDIGRLVATAISNVQARAEMRRLADEQAALRRLALESPADGGTLVAAAIPLAR
jgi:hypothetical protein